MCGWTSGSVGALFNFSTYFIGFGTFGGIAIIIYSVSRKLYISNMSYT